MGFTIGGIRGTKEPRSGVRGTKDVRGTKRTGAPDETGTTGATGATEAGAEARVPRAAKEARAVKEAKEPRSGSRRRCRSTAEECTAVAEYTGLWGWAVVPGARAQDGHCSCGRADCAAPGAHPLDFAPEIAAGATLDEVTEAWSQVPGASVMLPVGRAFDVIEVAEAAGRRALVRLERMGLPLGPVTATPDGRTHFFVAPGAAAELPQLVDPLEGDDDADQDDGTHEHRGKGGDFIRELPGRRVAFRRIAIYAAAVGIGFIYFAVLEQLILLWKIWLAPYLITPLLGAWLDDGIEFDEDDEENNVSLAAMEAELKPKVLETFDRIAKTYKSLRKLQDQEVAEKTALSSSQERRYRKLREEIGTMIREKGFGATVIHRDVERPPVAP